MRDIRAGLALDARAMLVRRRARKVRHAAECEVGPVSPKLQALSWALARTAVPFILGVVAACERGVCPARMRLSAEFAYERLKFSDTRA